MDHETLRSEIDNDPANLGYAPLAAAGSDAGIADLLNASGTERVSLGIVTKSLFVAQFSAQILTILSDAGLTTAFNALLQMLKLTDTVDYGLPVVQQALTGMIGIAGLTQDQITSITTRACSRAETLFGVGTVISSNDVAAAFGRV